MSELIVGSRGSELALHQARWVAARIEELNPGVRCTIRVIKTTGDQILDTPLAHIGGKGIFVREIEQALMRGEIDLAVHSAKDLPSEMDESLFVAAYPERENPADALISKSGDLSELPAGAIVGTSSVRRRAQILAARPDLKVADLRGNLDTRLRKLCSPDYDAIVLACAGLNRLHLEMRITQVLPYDVCLPAVGQGALAVQCRKNDSAVAAAAKLDHAPTRRAVSAERALLAALGGGCQVPVAALAHEDGGELRIDALAASIDGLLIIRRNGSGRADIPEEIGTRVAEELLAAGAKKLLEEARIAGQENMGAAG